MINALINGGVLDWIYDTLCMLPAIIVGLSLHEYAHAKVAELCGDPTPRYMGRVSIDPRAHMDWFGFISLLLIHFGWGKPVVVNPSNFNNRRRDSILVGIAGVTMNFVVATVTGLILRLIISAGVWQHFVDGPGRIIWDILFDIVVMNYSLMLFNLLPVPPLDGFGIISDIFNIRYNKVMQFIYKNSMMILILFILFDIPSMLLSRPLNFLINLVVL